VSNCDGRCCAVFYLPVNHYEAGRWPYFSEGEQIAGMVVSLTPVAAELRRVRFGIPYPFRAYHAYTCVHWDEDTRLCREYETRPLMCSEFPYDSPCPHGCGYALRPGRMQEYRRSQNARRLE
jgi:Fe-S-cluster containining protein